MDLINQADSAKRFDDVICWLDDLVGKTLSSICSKNNIETEVSYEERNHNREVIIERLRKAGIEFDSEFAIDRLRIMRNDVRYGNRSGYERFKASPEQWRNKAVKCWNLFIDEVVHDIDAKEGSKIRHPCSVCGGDMVWEIRNEKERAQIMGMLAKGGISNYHHTRCSPQTAKPP